MTVLTKISQQNGFVFSDFSPADTFKTLNQLERDPRIKGLAFHLLYMVSQRRNIPDFEWSKARIMEYLGIGVDVYKRVKRSLTESGYLRLKQTGYKGWRWEWNLGDEARKQNPDMCSGEVDQQQLELEHTDSKNLSTAPVVANPTSGKTPPLIKKPLLKKKENRSCASHKKKRCAKRPTNASQLTFSFEDLTTAFVANSIQGLVSESERQGMAITVRQKLKTTDRKTPDHWRNLSRWLTKKLVAGSTVSNLAGGNVDVGIPDFCPW